MATKPNDNPATEPKNAAEQQGREVGELTPNSAGTAKAAETTDSKDTTPVGVTLAAEALANAAATAADKAEAAKRDNARPERRTNFAGGPEGPHAESIREEASYDGNLVTLPVLLVTCKAGLDEVPMQVFEHEIPILERKFPEGVKIEDEHFAELDIPDDASIEFARLTRVHARHRHANVVAEVVGSAQILANVTGLSLGRKPADQVQAVVKANKPVAKGRTQANARARTPASKARR